MAKSLGLGMALEAFLDSTYQFEFSSGVLNQVTEGTMQPSRSDSLIQEDGQYQAVVASLLNASSRNFPGSAAKIAQMDEGMVSDVTYPTNAQETANFHLSSFRSLFPDDSSAVSRGRQLQRSASANLYSYLNLPPLPVFSSHSLSSPGSSVTDGSSTMLRTCHLGLNSSQPHKRKQQHRGFTTTSPTDLQRRQSSSLNGITHDLCTLSEVHKKPRLDILQPKLKNEKLQNVLQSTSQAGQVDMEKLQQQQRMGQHQLVHQGPAAYALHSGVCSRRIMQYMYHMRHRPSDNGIAYWKKFVAEYYAPCAKKRWCLSSYDNMGYNALGVFPKAAMDAWQCDLCGSKSGRGFEANLEALPRLNKIAFESGVIDELLYLDLPHECVQFCGLMMLEYGKAVQEIVYEQFRVVRVGKLRVVFTPDLKILSWEFCAQHHEELLSRNLVVPQVNQLVQTAQKCQSTINFSGSNWASPHDLQANCNLFLVAGCQLARKIGLQSVDNLGFSKRYIRCLQIAEIANSMKDLITFSLNNNIGPIESLKNYSWESEPLKDESQENGSAHGLLNNGRKLMAASPVRDNSKNDSLNLTACGPVSGAVEAMLSPGYYGRLLRQNSFNPEMSKIIQEPSSSTYGSGASSKSFQGPKASKSGLVQNLSVGGLSSFNSLECKQKSEERMIRKLLQEMINNSRTANGGEVEKVNLRTTSSEVASKVEYSNSTSAWFASRNAANSAVGGISSVTDTSSVRTSGTYGNDNFIRTEQYFPEVTARMVFGYYDNRISDDSGGNTSYDGKIGRCD